MDEKMKYKVQINIIKSGDIIDIPSVKNIIHIQPAMYGDGLLEIVYLEKMKK